MEALLGLRPRIDICKAIIAILEKENDDPRQPEALEFYRKQLAELEGKLNRPPDIVINLQPGKLTGKGLS